MRRRDLLTAVALLLGTAGCSGSENDTRTATETFDPEATIPPIQDLSINVSAQADPNEPHTEIVTSGSQDRIELLRYTFKKSSISASVQGKVRNNVDEELIITVGVKFLNDSGEVVGQTVDFDQVPGGETWEFNAMYATDESIASYKLSVTTSYMDESS